MQYPVVLVILGVVLLVSQSSDRQFVVSTHRPLYSMKELATDESSSEKLGTAHSGGFSDSVEDLYGDD
jgi:hypothetical protein